MKTSKLFTIGILSLVITGTVLGCSKKVEIDESAQGKKIVDILTMIKLK